MTIAFMAGFAMVAIGALAEHYFIQAKPHRAAMAHSLCMGLCYLIGWNSYAHRDATWLIATWIGATLGYWAAALWRRRKLPEKSRYLSNIRTP